MGSFFRSVALITAGVAAGFAAAHFINSTEKGRAAFADINARLDEVTAAVKQGYNARTEAIYSAIEQNTAAK